MTRKRQISNPQRIVLQPGRQMIGPDEARQILRDYPSGRVASHRLVDFQVRLLRGDIAPGTVHWLSDGLDIMGAFMDGARDRYHGDLAALDAQMRQRAEALARAEWEAGSGYPTAGVCPRHVIIAAMELDNMTGLEWGFLMAVRDSARLVNARNANIRADNKAFAEEKRVRESRQHSE